MEIEPAVGALVIRETGQSHRSVDRTAAGLGSDERRWHALFDRPVARFDALNDDIMGPLLRVPHHPLTLARFGVPTTLPASASLRRWRPRSPTGGA